MRSNRFVKFFNSRIDANTRTVTERIFRNDKGEPFAQVPDGSGFQAKINNTSDSEIEIVMHDAIGDYWSGLDSKTVVSTIKAAKGKRICLDINSFGGSAYDGIAIYNALAAHDSEVIANITGIGYSAASIIPMAADTICIAENGSLGIHPAWLYTVGNQFQLRSSAEWLTTLDGQLIDTYIARTGRTKAEITKWFEGESKDGTVFSGKECVEYGFADELLPLKTRKTDDKDADDSAVGKPPNDIRARLDAVMARTAAAARAEKLRQIKSRIDRR